MAFAWEVMAFIYRPMRRVWPFSALAAAEHAHLRKLVKRAELNCPCIGVDLGCGVGHARTVLPSRAVVFGVDRSLKMALRAADAASYQGVVAADIRFLPFATQFDFVVCVGVLEYLSDSAAFLTNTAAILRPGGCLLCTLSPDSGITLLRRFFGPPVYLHEPKGLIDRAEKAGYKLLDRAGTRTQSAFLFRFAPQE